MARAVGGRACIPSDCLTVTVMTSSGGSSQPPPQAEGPHSQHRERSFSPGKGEPTPEEPSSKKQAGSQPDIRQMGGGAQSETGMWMEDGKDCSIDSA